MSIRKFINIVEKYTMDNTSFRNYMRDGEFDPYATWWFICKWIEDNDYLNEMSEAAGHPITSADELHEEEPDLFYKLPENVQEQCAEWVSDYMMQHNPGEASTRSHMSLNKPKLLHRQTWLVHFSDRADQIQYSGFTIGMDQMDKLGLTTYYTDAAKVGGYNFAFGALSRDADRAAYGKKYGEHAVMFQNSGVHCYHYGDEEDQIVFWGADVDPKDIILLHRYDGDWKVMSRVDTRRGDRVLFSSENYEDAAKWVVKNHRQYARYLYGR